MNWHQTQEKAAVGVPSAGSTLKRPTRYFAGRLDSGRRTSRFYRGRRPGVRKHCGFVINRDHATSADIPFLCRQVQEKVKEQSGVDLELEVKLLGEF